MMTNLLGFAKITGIATKKESSQWPLLRLPKRMESKAPKFPKLHTKIATLILSKLYVRAVKSRSFLRIALLFSRVYGGRIKNKLV